MIVDLASPRFGLIRMDRGDQALIAPRESWH
jgi:hypothetical protein